jgi:DNA invertase Pin-like site-specific DNA recombinase
MRAAIYARVSTLDQHVENQLVELGQYCERRGWAATEFVDRGVSGAKDRRPALEEMLKAAKRRKFDVVVCWRLDRLGRNLRHPHTYCGDVDPTNKSFRSSTPSSLAVPLLHHERILLECCLNRNSVLQ